MVVAPRSDASRYARAGMSAAQQETRPPLAALRGPSFGPSRSFPDRSEIVATLRATPCKFNDLSIPQIIVI